MPQNIKSIARKARLHYLVWPVFLTIAPALAQAPAPQLKMLATNADIQTLIAKEKAEIKPGQVFVSKPAVALPPYTVTLDYRVLHGLPAVHETEAELFYVVQGRGTLTIGGSMTEQKRTDAANLTGAGIKGGTDYVLSKGDVFFVPQGTAHMWVPIGGPVVDLALHVPRR
jgi:mannose-6-phosphate isomerase-like protein (cupin superfamily)